MMAQKLDPESTKFKILKSATNLIQARSYNSFSYQDVAKEVGIKKASIHYHFPTKEILGIEAIRFFKSKVKYLMNKLEREIKTSSEKLDEYFKYFQNDLDRNNVCPAGVLSAEFNTLTPEMQQELRELFDFYLEWLARMLEEGRKTGEFVFEGSSMDKAMLFNSTIEGALIYTRSYQKPKHYEVIVKQLKESVLPHLTN